MNIRAVILSLCLLSLDYVNAIERGNSQPTTGVSAAVSPTVHITDRLLIEAEEKNDLAKAKQAISAGADMNGLTTYGVPFIWSSLIRGNFDMVLTLLKSGAKVVDYNGKSFAQAVLNKAISLYRNPNPQLSFVTECLSLLVANGINFSNVVSDAYDGKGQDIAAFAINLCERLVTSRADHDVYVSKAIVLELVQQLTNHGYSIVEKLWNKGGDNRLYQDKDWVGICLKNGVDMNQNIIVHMQQIWMRSGEPFSGPTPKSSVPALFIAVIRGDQEALQVLLDAGANINQLVDPDGKGMQTPLDWALAHQSSHRNTIDFLLKYGAKTSKQLQSIGLH